MVVNMEPRLLARMQKDLDGYTELYQARLEKMTGKYIKELGPAWHNMQNQLLKQVKALYVEAGAIEDPKKIKTLNNKAARLEALAAQLEKDILVFEKKQQPFYTGALKNLYEDSYYFNSYLLEQAARVSVAVPLLTPYHVLGILANPWLPDGANYSSRIRGNTSRLAAVMREAITKGVAYGRGWNETAHLIKDKTGESYYNAVRLARTEFTRAAAQGASYSYMNNADILDGKRWNATKDSRTAPKDAINDGDIYDLDYDTVENPGAPGRRIPNHPNCRCLWSPVLSALGVQDKGRIARGEGDTPTTWGRNTYTKAKNYKAYAKERGLPNTDDVQAFRNLKSYLRPGETVADLNKKVVYWTHKGGNIAVARPDWDIEKKAPKDIPTVAKSAPVVAEVPKVNNKANEAAIANFDNEIKGLAGNMQGDRRKTVKALLEKAGLNLKVSIKQIKGALGQCTGYFPTDGPIKYISYELLSNNAAAERYQLKTVFHELFHAKAQGLIHDNSFNYLTSMSTSKWTYIEESFTELASHYMARRAGIEGTIIPSYERYLVDILPRLKKLEEFKGCITLEDFGENILKYRYGKEATAIWEAMYKHVKAVDVDTAAWAAGYKERIEANIDSLVNELYERNSQDNKFKSEEFFKNHIRKGVLKDTEKGSGPWYDSAVMYIVAKEGV